MVESANMQELLEAGVHFGHQTRRWNPKMQPFIYSDRNGIHILDLAQTTDRLQEALAFVEEVAGGGGKVLFVGTKKQAQEVVQQEAERCEMPYVVHRWLGGTLTNWQTISGRIQHMLRLERQEEAGMFETLPKIEAQRRRDEITRLRRYVGGLRSMEGLPAALFVIDVPKEAIAVKEGTRLTIPIVALCDSNCDPTPIAYPIPSNDDAIRAIRLITRQIGNAVLAGRGARESAQADSGGEGSADAAPRPVSAG